MPCHPVQVQHERLVRVASIGSTRRPRRARRNTTFPRQYLLSACPRAWTHWPAGRGVELGMNQDGLSKRLPGTRCGLFVSITSLPVSNRRIVTVSPLPFLFERNSSNRIYLRRHTARIASSPGLQSVSNTGLRSDSKLTDRRCGPANIPIYQVRPERTLLWASDFPVFRTLSLARKNTLKPLLRARYEL